MLHVGLDRFKEIKDVLGHSASNTVLKAVAERLEKHLRSRDQAELAKAIDAVAARGWELEGVVWFRRGDTEMACRTLRRACDLGQCRAWQGTCARAESPPRL